MQTEILTLIEEGKTGEALEKADKFYKEHEKSSKVILLLKSKYNRIKEKEQLSLIKFEDRERELTKINMALIEIANNKMPDINISDINELTVEQILDDNFKKYLDKKGKSATLNLLDHLFDGGKSNEKIILNFITHDANSVQELSLKSGFKENKIVRILKRLNKKGEIQQSENGWILKQ